HRRLRDEEGSRDLGRLEAADRAQRQCDLRLQRERRVTASEDESQPLVGNDVLLVVRVYRLLEQLHLARERALTAHAVDRRVASGRDDPAGRVPRLALDRPALERTRVGVLQRVLGELEVAEDANQRCEDSSVLLAKDGFDYPAASAVTRDGTTGRTSIV